MKIATFNIDWAKKKNPKKTEEFLNNFDFDFLILTEAVDLNLENFPYKYLCSHIPENIVYENLNYSKYLKGKKAFRTILYSKIPYLKKYQVMDNKTNLALEFETDLGRIVFYCTIIGTWFNRKPFAENELNNTIQDCRKIHLKNPNIFIVGDFNTSFKTDEEKLYINSETTQAVKKLFQDLLLINSTSELEKNIDHIVIPEIFADKVSNTGIFIDKNILSDHQGVFIFIETF